MLVNAGPIITTRHKRMQARTDNDTLRRIAYEAKEQFGKNPEHAIKWDENSRGSPQSRGILAALQIANSKEAMVGLLNNYYTKTIVIGDVVLAALIGACKRMGTIDAAFESFDGDSQTTKAVIKVENMIRPDFLHPWRIENMWGNCGNDEWVQRIETAAMDMR